MQRHVHLSFSLRLALTLSQFLHLYTLRLGSFESFICSSEKKLTLAASVPVEAKKKSASKAKAAAVAIDVDDDDDIFFIFCPRIRCFKWLRCNSAGVDARSERHSRGNQSEATSEEPRIARDFG